MRKMKLITILVVALVLLMGTISSSAQGPDGDGWWANFTIQNTTGADASVMATAYNSANSDTHSESITLEGDTSVIFHPGLSANCTDPVTTANSGCRIGLSPDLSAGFEGSVVVSSDSPVVAVTNLNNNASGSVGVDGGAARSAYQGVDGSLADTTLYFPTVKNDFNGQTTIFFVQAAGADATVTIDYEMNDGGSYSQGPVTIDANKMFAFTPSAASVPSCNGGNGGGGNVANCFGGATVTSSDNPVAGVVVEYIDGASVAEFVLATRGLTTSDAGTRLVAPAMKNDFNDATTGATLLNTSGTQATVDLTFTVTNVSAGCSNNIGDTDTDQITIDPGSSVVVNRFQGNTGSLDSCTFYSMVADTTTSGTGEEIVMTVSENRTYQGATVKAVYTGFNTANATDTVFFPLAKEFFNGNTSGLTVVNAGTTAATITATYVGGGSTLTLTTASPIEAGAAAAFFNASGGNAGNFTGDSLVAGEKYSVVFTSSEPLVGLGQESDRDTSNGVLDISNYEGFNQ